MIYLCDDSAGHCRSIEARDWLTAERYAKSRGWVLLGEYVDSVACDEVVEAMIQQQYNEIH